MQINGSVGITFPDGTVQTTAAVGGGTVTGVTAVAPLTSSGGVSPAISLTGIVSPANGGTGAASLTGFLFGNGASPATPATATDLTTLLSTTPVALATGIAAGAANQIVVQSGSATTTFITAPVTPNTVLEWTGTAFAWAAPLAGTVTTASVVAANGFAGTVTNPTTTPAITLTTSVNGLVIGNGSAISAAVASDITGLLGANPVTVSTNLNGGLAGSLPYQSGPNTTAFLGIGTPGQVLKVSAGNLPTWGSPAAAAVLTIGTGLDGTSYDTSSAVTIKLADTAVSPGTYGTAISIPRITVDQQGRLTAVTTNSTIGVSYQGVWNAATNTPILANGTGTQGQYYVTNVAGTNGLGTFAIGDWIVYNGATWDKVDNSQTTSVANFSITGIPAGRYLIGGGSSPITGQVGVPASDITGGAIAVANGGTGLATYTTGDTLYASAATTLSTLAIGAVGYIMTSTGTAPQWVNSNTLTVAKATNIAGGAAGSLPYQSAADTTTFLAPGTNGQVLSLVGGVPAWTAVGGTGTVTSVATAGTVNGLTLSGGPITSTGTITLGGTLDLSSPPAIGGTTAAAVSGTTVTATTQFTGAGTGLTGTAAGLSIGGTAAEATSVAGGAAGSVLYQSAAGVTAKLPIGTNGQFLSIVGGVPTWAAGGGGGGGVTSVSVVSANGFGGTVANPTTAPDITLTTSITGVLKGDGTAISAASASDITTLIGTNAVSTATNLAGGVAGSLPYQSAAGTTAFTAAGTPGQVLTSNGTGAPTWTAVGGSGTVTSVSTAGTVNGLTLTGGPITTTGTITLGGTLDLSSPPAIGGTAPAGGAFTVLTASTSVTFATSGNVDISPTGTLVLNPVNAASSMDNVTIGATTAASIVGTTITAAKFVGVSGGVF